MTPDISEHFPKGPISGEFPLGYNGRRFITDRVFEYHDIVDGLAVDVAIEVGFLSDFNSTPQMVWWWFPPTECPEAGLTHDWLYQHPNGLERKQIDRIHRRIMELKGERKSKRSAAWLGIRAGGWKPWNAYRKRDAEAPETAA